MLRAGLLLAALFGSIAPSHAHGRHSKPWGVEERRTRSEVILLQGATRLLVDNLQGSVRVTGGPEGEIRMAVTETIRARDQEAVERARREVSLDVSRDPSGIAICVNGLFRLPEDCAEMPEESRLNWRRHWDDEEEYTVVYDLELLVPGKINLKARTVEGNLDVSRVSGQFRIIGVNGSVHMSEIGGWGEARSVNGSVTVAFDSNPAEDCIFKTINGDIEVSFKSGLSADMTFKTMNGEVMTDFDYETLPPAPTRVEFSEGRTKFRLDASTGIRIASGGPRVEFESLNGDILVRKTK